MSIPSSKAAVVLRRIVIAAVITLVVGAALLLTAIVLDMSGLWGGFVQGAGIGLIAVGTYLWGFANGLRRGGTRASWLPSQAGQE